MKVSCGKCGGDVPLEQETRVTQCPYCESRLYVDVGKSVLHYVMQPALDGRQCKQALSTHLRRRDSTQSPIVTKEAFQLLPFWKGDLEDRAPMVLAAAVGCAALGEIPLPSGDLKFFDPDKIAMKDVVAPELRPAGDAAGTARPVLVHLPVHRFRYQYGGRPYVAFVEAAGGRVFADEWPASASAAMDRAFSTLMAAAAVVFAVEAMVLPTAGLALLAIGATAAGFVAAARSILNRRSW